MVTSLDVVRQILAYNAGRDPERLALKYAAMRRNDFAFMRGSGHLFYQRLPRGGIFKSAPLAWISGDAHLENFGSYKADNRLAYFDLNDFDEAVLAPLSWELVRLLVSVHLAVPTLNQRRGSEPDKDLCRRLIEAYAQALVQGKAFWLDRAHATGVVSELLDGLGQRSRVDFLDARTVQNGKRRLLRVDGANALPASAAQREAVSRWMADFARHQPHPKFFEVLDVARRVAGLASLGLARDVILVRGKGSPDGNYLLDLKPAPPSVLLPRLKVAQPRWANQAERVVSLQRRLQAMPMAFLHAVPAGGQTQVLRGLQPAQDRVALDRLGPKSLADLAQTLGRLLAWSQLRGAGQQGSANADALIDFGQRNKWRAKLAEAAADCAAQVRADAQVFNAAFDDGGFKV